MNNIYTSKAAMSQEAPQTRPNDLNRLIATIHELDASLECIMLEEADVNSSEKLRAIIAQSKQEQESNKVRMFDCSKIRDKATKNNIFFGPLQFNIRFIFLFHKGVEMCVEENALAHQLRLAFHKVNDICDDCFICAGNYGSYRYCCGICGFALCYKCRVRITMHAILNGTSLLGEINCPQCSALMESIIEQMLDANRRLIISPTYLRSIMQPGDIDTRGRNVLNLLAAYLNHFHHDAPDTPQLIAEVLGQEFNSTSASPGSSFGSSKSLII